jgi:hypothetical protein
VDLANWADFEALQPKKKPCCFGARFNESDLQSAKTGEAFFSQQHVKAVGGESD